MKLNEAIHRKKIKPSNAIMKVIMYNKATKNKSAILTAEVDKMYSQLRKAKENEWITDETRTCRKKANLIQTPIVLTWMRTDTYDSQTEFFFYHKTSCNCHRIWVFLFLNRGIKLLRLPWIYDCRLLNLKVMLSIRNINYICISYIFMYIDSCQ